MNNVFTTITGSRVWVSGRPRAFFSAILLLVALSGCPVQTGVPSVVGLTTSEAENLLLDAGYTPGTITEVFSDEPVGQVISQMPAAGSTVASDTPVDFEVSIGLPTTVPRLIGMTRTAAEAAVVEAMFTVGQVTEAPNALPAGQVFNQRPAPGAAAAPQSPINLEISTGIQEIVVPDIVGRQSAEAGAMIATAGLRLGTITMESSNEPAGEVLVQNPLPGARVMPASRIDIAISSGDAASAAAVPDLSGLTESSATTALTDAGLRLGGVTERFSDAPEGSVVGQSPPPGTMVLRESLVDISISGGVEPITVPDLVGLQSAVAGASIASAGLRLGDVTMTGSTAPPGEVLSQNPAAGATLTRGAAVNITVSESADTAVVPNLVGTAATAASSVLADAGLRLGDIIEVYGDMPVGEIVVQLPPAGTLVLQDAEVDIQVSRGAEFVAVPDVIGRTSARAGADIAGARLRLGTITEVASEEPPGEVLAQTPAPGSMVAADTTVDLTVSESVGAAVVPNVIGGTEAEADAVIEAAGFLLGAVENVFSDAPVGEVIGQSPDAGVLALLESPVDIQISAGVEIIAVPDLVGVSQAQAGVMIANARLGLGAVTEVVSFEPGGQVVAQDPVAGTEVVAGTPVSIDTSSGAVPVVVPDVAASDLESALASLAAGELVAGEITVMAQVTDPAVMVLAQDPAAGVTVAEGSSVTLTVSVPPDPDAFLSLVNTPVDESEATGQAYYDAVDPLGEKTTLENWFNANGFGAPGGVEAAANYFNEFDLGFGRQVLMRRDGGNIAFAVLNHTTVDATWQDPNHPFVAVCMELTPAPAGGDPFIKYFTFDANGDRIAAADLDGRGNKFQPGMCSSCHGGQPRPLVDGLYPNGGDVGARFIPFDLESFLYSELNADYSREAQEDALKSMNAAVLDSYDVVRRHRFAYTGSSVPIPDASAPGVFVPITVSGLTGTISDVNFSFEGTGSSCEAGGDPATYGLNHTWVSDLVISLESPAGTIVTLLNRQGGSSDNLCSPAFDDEATSTIASSSVNGFAGTWLPATALSAFDGENPNGEWILGIADLAAADTGALNHFALSLRVDGGEPTAAETLVEGWYGGADLPGDFNDDFVPPAWQAPDAATLYSQVFKQSCRNCHIQLTERLPAFDFDSFAEFDAAKNRIREVVFVEGTMPAALRTYDSFWLSAFPSRPALLADFAGHGTTGPGGPIANAGVDRMVTVGDLVTLDGSGSVFATTFQWAIESLPGGSSATLSGADTAMPSFTPDVAGTYVVSLTVSSGGDPSAPDTVTITATVAPMPVSFVNEVVPVFMLCTGCHAGAGQGGLSLDSGDINTLYNEVAVETSTAAGPLPRVNLASPMSSLILTRPSGVGHGGGTVPGFSLHHDTILEWIQEGAANN